MKVTMNILVLCQRKKASDDSAFSNKVIVDITVKRIKNYMESQVPDHKLIYTFMTPGVNMTGPGDPGVADISKRFEMSDPDVRSWVDRNIGHYGALFLNTCPIPLISPLDYYGMSKVLKTEGRFYIGRISSREDHPVDTVKLLYSKKKMYDGMSPYFLPTLRHLFYHKGGAPYLTKVTNPPEDLWVLLNKWACERAKSRRAVPGVRDVYEELVNVIAMQPYYLQAIWKQVAEFVVKHNKGDTGLGNAIIELIK